MLTPSDIIQQISSSISKLNDQYEIEGELHNYSKRNSNIFASIKDSSNSIDLICWNCPNDFDNGDKVKVKGKINFYKKTSKINLQLMSIEKIGIGDQFKLYSNLKLEFQKAGYFDKKKIMPKQINSIGIVTSQDGAALQDILYVFKSTNFNAKIIIKDCIVQGTNAPKSISDAIKSFTTNVDILLITRGGGSLEDLMAFSSREVIEAIHQSKIFTISAVGHEVDSMLSDFVADLRAPTPSIGAQFILNEYSKKFLIINDVQKLLEKIRYELYSRFNSIKNIPSKHELISKKIVSHSQNILDEIRSRFKKSKSDYEKILTKIESKEHPILLNTETGIKINDINSICNDMIIIIGNKKILIEIKNIIYFD